MDGIAFNGVQQLQGGSGDDSFELAAGGSLSGGIDGGGGANTLKGSGAANQWQIGSGGNRLNGMGFSHIQHLQDSAASFSLSTDYSATLAAGRQIALSGSDITAFTYAAPPHGGIAFGLDRMVALICGTTSIRDVIAFPKTQKGQDLMAQSPTPVTAKQLKELHIQTVQPE